MEDGESDRKLCHLCQIIVPASQCPVRASFASAIARIRLLRRDGIPTLDPLIFNFPWIIHYTTCRIWSETQTTSGCRKNGMPSNFATKPWWMIISSLGQTVLRRMRHERLWLRSMASPSKEQIESSDGFLKKQKNGENTIFCKNFHLHRNT